MKELQSNSDNGKPGRALPPPPPKPVIRSREAPSSAPSPGESLRPRFPSPPPIGEPRVYRVSGRGSYQVATPLSGTTPVAQGPKTSSPVPIPPETKHGSSLPRLEDAPTAPSAPRELGGGSSLNSSSPQPAAGGDSGASAEASHPAHSTDTKEGKDGKGSSGPTRSSDARRLPRSIPGKRPERRSLFKVFASSGQDRWVTFLSVTAAVASWLTAALLLLLYLDILR